MTTRYKLLSNISAVQDIESVKRVLIQIVKAFNAEQAATTANTDSIATTNEDLETLESSLTELSPYLRVDGTNPSQATQYPDTNDAYDLGTLAAIWRTVYASKLAFSSGTAIDVNASDITFSPGGVASYILNSSALRAMLDSSCDLGTASFRWRDIYLDAADIAGDVDLKSVGKVVNAVDPSNPQDYVTLNFLTLLVAAYLVKANNLSDLTNVATARTNLGLGDSATKDVGPSSGQVAAGDHKHTDLDAMQIDGLPLFGHRHAYTDTFLDSSNWNGTTGGAGVQTIIGPNNFSWLDDVNDFGFLRLTCGAGTASTDYRAVRPTQLSGMTIDYDASATEWVVAWRIATNSTTDIRCRVGVWAATITGTSATAGISFEFDTGSSANVQCRVHDGTTPSDTDSGVTVASFSETMRWCELRLSSAGATFRIDGTTVATVSTGLPTGSNSLVYPQMAFAGAGTTWRSLVVDTFLLTSAGSNGIESLI